MNNRVAIAFSTKDRVLLSQRSIKPLLRGKFDLWWIDGSTTSEGKKFFEAGNKYVPPSFMFGYVRGGSGAAIVFALSKMLAHGVGNGTRYEYIGLIENDCLLPRNWFDKTMALFKTPGLRVGAVSARTYEDRILIQRDGYAVMHNTGAGCVIFSRTAAEIILRTYRTQWTTENRLTFAQLIDDDIGSYWAFRGSEHWLCADWRWDSVLAAHGYASLGLVPSHVEMIGQVPPLEQQGLKIADKPVDSLRSDERFAKYVERIKGIVNGWGKIETSGLFYRDAMGGEMIFAHQLHAIGGEYHGDWRLKDSIGFGPFGWKATDTANCSITIPMLGPCAIFLSGGAEGGQVEVIDKKSGFNARPSLPPEGPQGLAVPVAIPVNVSYRDITVRPLTSGIVFYGVRCRDTQPHTTNFQFNHAMLPPV